MPLTLATLPSGTAATAHTLVNEVRPQLSTHRVLRLRPYAHEKHEQ